MLHRTLRLTTSFAFVALCGCKILGLGDNDSRKRTTSNAPQGATNPNATANTADPGTIEALIAKSAFLKASDFKAMTTLHKQKEEEIADSINYESVFFQKPPKDSSADDPCHTKLLGTAKLSASKTLVWFDFTGQLANCNPDPAITQTNNTTRMLFAKECINQDLSSFNGANPDKMNDIKCNNGGKTYAAISMQMSGTSTGTGMSISSDTKMIWLQQSTDGKPCEVTQTGSTFRNGACTVLIGGASTNVKVNGSPSTDTSIPRGSYKKIDLAGLTFTNINDKYYSSGSASFVMNNISGTMTYSGATTAPKWEAKLSGSTKKIAGTFNPK